MLINVKNVYVIIENILSLHFAFEVVQGEFEIT